MEPKQYEAPFLPTDAGNGRAVSEPHAAVIECALENGYTVRLEGFACFPGSATYAHVSFALTLSEEGVAVRESCTGLEQFAPPTAKPRFCDVYELFLGKVRLVPGFAGKAITVPGQGWLPARLLLKIEPT